MAFVIANTRRIIQPRFLTIKQYTTTKNDETDIKKSVFISQSKDIFSNLALEDWIHLNMNFENHHVMLLWINDSCVVIGRNQNPWAETNVDMLKKNGIKLARRVSGGGCVYHDLGNLNITFFCPKTRYNRKNNLQLLAKTLENEWNLRSEINKKDDIIVNGKYKISGTASRIARPNSYHHCTLLVDCNKNVLKSSLEKNIDLFISQSKATKSIPSPTVNLSELHSGLTINNLITAIGWQYLRTCPLSQEDKGWDYAQKQNGFKMVNPSEEWFSGIEKLKQDLESWKWKFGTTPEFKITKNILLEQEVALEIKVQAGIVTNVSMTLPSGINWKGITGKCFLYSTAVGKKFDTSVFTFIENTINPESITLAEDIRLS